MPDSPAKIGLGANTVPANVIPAQAGTPLMANAHPGTNTVRTNVIPAQAGTSQAGLTANAHQGTNAVRTNVIPAQAGISQAALAANADLGTNAVPTNVIPAQAGISAHSRPTAETQAATAEPRILWLRRDLRLTDHPALNAAATGPVLVLFVVDPAFFEAAGAVRPAWLAANLIALNEALDDRLCVRFGDAREVVPAVAAEIGAREVHVSTETEPAGAARDAAVRASLAATGVEWVETGSPYAVTPGRIRNREGGGYRVFTAFHRAWLEHGWRSPAVAEAAPQFLPARSDEGAWHRLRAALYACPIQLPGAGETAALDRWQLFLDENLDGYADARDRPDLDRTSHLSADLKFGVLHPRTLLADLAERPGPDADRYATELAWREFYADVLWRNPDSLVADLYPLGLSYAEPDQAFDAWRDGRTGFPIVDAGMRQLLSEGWMHNRVRMITASFLTKDLHVWWPHGARHFLDHLIDGDLASNTHGWQWTAGTGTDAAPYFRVFNPVTQGVRFDPDGAYVRRYVPELRHLPGASVHRPWATPDGYAHDYPAPIVDHAQEREVALARYRAAREGGTVR